MPVRRSQEKGLHGGLEWPHSASETQGNLSAIHCTHAGEEGLGLSEEGSGS
ncbi:hypothetical protein Oscil6304_4608 [Oscillatoria acuminata PCC 6304]|uniref:Uncharacterized protein n=1 Tax=Oscillatoria acuminata PCC 6304 TaxID=56110 RepID=K9TPM6_9CYAN|nr:hypothetical protein Oscil6304_4608 [Oscillatoria acuminata PCC 6304]